MEEANPHCKGVLLRGSSLYRERAIEFLKDQNHDFELAKLHILFPSRMKNDETRHALEEMLKSERPSIKQLIQDTVGELKEQRKLVIDGLIV
jgi:hypothetical protein